MFLQLRGTQETVVYLRVCLTVGRCPRHVPLPVRDMNPHVCPSGGGGHFSVLPFAGWQWWWHSPTF